MGKKFQSEDLFRIAENNLSAQEDLEFRFAFSTGKFRETVGDVLSLDLKLENDERDLLEKIFSRLRSGGILRSGAR